MSDAGKKLLQDCPPLQQRRRVASWIVVVATTSVIVLGIAVSFPIRWYYAEKAAVQAQLSALHTVEERVKKLGGKIRYASPAWADSLELRSIDGIDLSGTEADGSVIKTITGLKDLQRLSLDDTKLQPGDLEPLAGLVKLEWLSLARTTIGRSDLACLTTLPRLKTLSLAGTSITDTDVEPLAGMRAVSSLDISRTMLTADATRRKERKRTCTARAGTEWVRGFIRGMATARQTRRRCGAV